MEFPKDILNIIRKFSRPLTRPDWKTLHHMTSLSFHIALAREVNYNCPKCIYKLIINPQSDFIYDLEFFNGPRVYVIYNINNWSRHEIVPK